MSRVDFLICGAQKCGTTALDFYLRQHPLLCFPSKKELHYFDDEAVFAGGIPGTSRKRCRASAPTTRT